MVALTEEDVDKQEKDLAEKRDSCVVTPVEEDAEKDKKVESRAYSSFIEIENREFIVALVEEVEENDQEVEIRDFSSSTQGKGLNIEVENDNSIVVFVEGDKSTQVSSKKPVEEKSREDGIFKMVALTEEDVDKQEKDLAEKSDSCVVTPVEEDAEKDKKVESHAYSSFIEIENREFTVALVEEVQQNDHEVEIHDISSSTQGKGSKIEVENDDSIIVFVEGDEMKDQKVENQECSSSIEVENGDSIAALVDEFEENDQEVKIHGFSSSAQRVDLNIVVQNGDSTVVLVKGDEMKDQKVEIKGFSSSIEMENKESIVALVEEVEQKDQEVEIHDITSSTQGKGSKIEVENDDSIVVIVEGDEMKDQKVESQEYSSSIEVKNEDFIAALVDEVEGNDQEVKIHGFSSSIEVEENGDSIIALVEKNEENDREEEIHGLSFSSQKENSNIEVDEAFEFTKETGDQPPENEHVKDSGNQSPESDPLPENKSVEYCGDQSPENDLVEDSSNQRSEFVEVSDDLLPTNETVEDSGDHSFNACLDSLLCSERRPLLHKEAIVCSQESGGIEEEEGKLSLLFTEMNLKEANECGDTLLEPVVVQDASFVSKILPAPIAILQDADHVVTTDIVIPQDDCSLPTNEAVEDSGDHSNAKLAIPAGLDSLLCSEIRPLPHEEAIVYSQGSGGIEEEEPDECSDGLLELVVAQDHVATADIVIPQDGCSSLVLSPAMVSLDKISCESETMFMIEEEERLVSTEKTLKEPDECSDAIEEEGRLVFTEKTLKEPDECSDASFVSKNLPAAMVIRQDADHVATADIVIPQDDCSSLVLSPAMVTSDKIPSESETMFMIEPSIVQTQSSEEAGDMAATEITEEKAETKTKALEEEVFLKDENLELLSLTKLRAMYKQMLNCTKKEERKKSIIKQEDLDYSNCIKHDENCKQKLNDDMNKLRKSPLIKQADLECLSRSKLDSNCKQKLNDDKIKSERKRTPLKNLNYSTF